MNEDYGVRCDSLSLEALSQRGGKCIYFLHVIIDNLVNRFCIENIIRLYSMVNRIQFTKQIVLSYNERSLVRMCTNLKEVAAL